MINRPLPFYLEDRTGDYSATDYDEAYDRLFLRVACAQPAHDPDAGATLFVYDTGRRSSSRRPLARPPRDAEPAAVLEFCPGGGLGSVAFVRAGTSVPMGQYLRRTSMFSG